MHLKLTQVVSEITGVTGMAILKAILAGERDPQRPAEALTPPLPPHGGRHRQGAAGHLARRTPVCLTPSGRVVCLLSPADRPMCSADQSPSGDLSRYQCGPALAPEA